MYRRARKSSSVRDSAHFSRLLELLKLIVADLSLTDQDTAAETLDQVTADRPEPPSGQWPLRAMTNNDELRPYFLGDICNFLPWITRFQSCGR
jgi:hypothetical protein